MLKRVHIMVAGCLAVLASSVQAQEMSADEARQFVIDKTFSFNCFEGSRGAGRILPDGSAVGSVALRGMELEQEATIPSGTLYVEEGQVCANVAEASFKPCFVVMKTGYGSFRGHLAGYENVYCDFQQLAMPEPQGRRMKTLRSQRRTTAALEK